MPTYSGRWVYNCRWAGPNKAVYYVEAVWPVKLGEYVKQSKYKKFDRYPTVEEILNAIQEF